MREYVITMSVVAIICSVLEIAAPKEWEKYIKLGIGLIILSVILTPFTKMRQDRVSVNISDNNVNTQSFYDEISGKLKHNIEQDIELRLLEEFDIIAKAEVDIEIDEEHNIKGVNAIRIRAREKSDGITERLEEIYGCSRIEIIHE